MRSSRLRFHDRKIDCRCPAACFAEGRCGCPTPGRAPASRCGDFHSPGRRGAIDGLASICGGAADVGEDGGQDLITQGKYARARVVAEGPEVTSNRGGIHAPADPILL